MEIDESLQPPYQRSTCSLPIAIRLALLAERESPCARRNAPRATCGGEPRADGQPR